MAFVDKNKDVVNICPFDTKGEVITIDALKIQLPKVPDKEKILFHNLPKEEQYWRRHKIPEEIAHIQTYEEYKELPEDIQKRFDSYIKREWFRRKNGVWFYNNGKPIYITGQHYMFLQWDEFDFGYPKFIYAQWKLFIHWQACLIDDRCIGQIHGKNRRAGWSSYASSCGLTRATQARNFHTGIISKTDDDAKQVIFEDKIFRIFKNRPFFFKPINNAGNNAGSSLNFIEPYQRKTKNNRSMGKSNALGSLIDYKATQNNSYDGAKLHHLICDEMGKIHGKADFDKMWKVLKPTMYERTKLIGKAQLGSTVEELEKGGESFKKIWDASTPARRNNNGRTPSGLYKIFIPATETVILDRYGMPVIKPAKAPFIDIDGNLIEKGNPLYLGSEEWIKNELKSAKDGNSVNEYKRQFPVVESDMFRVVGGNSLNKERIYSQLEYNEQIVPPTRVGEFIWEGERFNSPVKWVDRDGGPWQVLFLLKEEDRNRQTYKNGLKAPMNEWLGAGGVDPYRTDVVVDGRGSNASAHFVTRPNMKYDNNVCFARYNGRPETLYLASEQILMGAIYFGVKVLIENNVRDMIRHWQNLGYDNYMYRRPPHLTPTGSRGVKDFGMPMSSLDVRSAHLLALQTFVDDHIGMKSDGHMNPFFFNATLKDLAHYDMHNATKHDDSISLGLALLALQTGDKAPPKKESVQRLARTFDNSGIRSKPR